MPVALQNVPAATARLLRRTVRKKPERLHGGVERPNVVDVHPKIVVAREAATAAATEGDERLPPDEQRSGAPRFARKKPRGSNCDACIPWHRPHAI